ncbi:cellulose biosynthesis cyclic di-GMP-binding regulatory protein BcsB [Peteryoungia desertarenae]|uniref:Cyclic di-GMP-binding protein n=1 Tax=Peteryoungia desertarenae TaxID=1813451 RepID=A0ABX6QJU9_9HYPH|nr:cellulose biosynthesis cyclic di-GMP-binding regulatory protein BcsB [Peteryoungia desertarenae]QLF68520.1 cellulose biosynthesis cyclic di-GMP-binding regulatory protein BcsB [Peteryoungia desertarenae]
MLEFRHRIALLALPLAVLSLMTPGQGHSASSLVPEALLQSMGTYPGSGQLKDWLVPFSQSKAEMWLSGEDDTRHLTFYLTPDEAAGGGRLRLTYTNAVSVMPEGAVLLAKVNGHAIGQLPIRSPQGMLANELPLPAGIVVAGWNTVTLRALHQHRVDCSIPATYELWTQIDPVTSGFVARTMPRMQDLSSILSVGRNDTGETELRIITSPGAVENTARESLAAVQALAILLGRDDLRVVYTETEGVSHGIDLYIGDPEAPGLSKATRDIILKAPTGLSVQRMENNRIRLILRGATPEALSLALANAFKGPLQPILTGRRSLEPPPSIHADESKRVTLAETGYETAPFTGRLFRTSFDLVMPEDFYPGDYGTIDLRLNAATAPGLEPGAQIMVRVNERAVTSHILHNPEGVTLKDKLLGLSLRAFQPGHNKVEILAELPHRADAACDPAGRHQAPRFLLLGETSLDIPKLARIGRMPDLAAFAGRGYPFNSAKRFDLVVDAATPVRLSTAATMLAKLSLASARPLLARLVIGSTVSDQAEHVLIIKAGASGMTETVASKAGRIMPREFDSLLTASVSTPASQLQPLSASDSQALLDAFQIETAMDSDALPWSSQLAKGLRHASAMVNRWLQYQQAGDIPRHIPSADTLVTLSQTSLEETGAMITTLAAANESDLLDGSRILFEPSAWASLTGGTATVTRSDHAIVSKQAESVVYHSLTDTSLGNLRRLAAAWLSDNFIVYVTLILFCIGGFGFWLGHIVPRRGVRSVK